MSGDVGWRLGSQTRETGLVVERARMSSIASVSHSVGRNGRELVAMYYLNAPHCHGQGRRSTELRSLTQVALNRVPMLDHPSRRYEEIPLATYCTNWLIT